MLDSLYGKSNMCLNHILRDQALRTLKENLGTSVGQNNSNAITMNNKTRLVKYRIFPFKFT